MVGLLEHNPKNLSNWDLLAQALCNHNLVVNAAKGNFAGGSAESFGYPRASSVPYHQETSFIKAGGIDTLQSLFQHLHSFEIYSNESGSLWQLSLGNGVM